jgi:hypothetical protein
MSFKTSWITQTRIRETQALSQLHRTLGRCTTSPRSSTTTNSSASLGAPVRTILARIASIAASDGRVLALERDLSAWPAPTGA